jgi:DNA-binding PadR family transcriptional regulator
VTLLSNAELAVLSLVAEEPRHGYQIETVIEERNMRYWTEIGFSSIYRILKKLEKDGLVESRSMEPQGRGPGRKVYHMTGEGWEIWRKASLEALATPTITNSTFLLGLDNLYKLNAAEALEALRTYQDSITLSREFLENHVKGSGEMQFFLGAFFDYLVTMLGAEIGWLGKFIAEMEVFSAEDAPGQS